VKQIKKYMKNFFKQVYETTTGGWIEIRTLPEAKQSFFNAADKDNLINHCIKKKATQNVFFGIGTRKKGNGSKEGIIELPGLWVDIDFKDMSADSLQDNLTHFPFKPSISIASGGGMHLYWLLREPATDNLLNVEGYLKGLAQKLHGDLAAAEIARILRPPLTLNHKYLPPREVKVVEQNTKRYLLNDFDDFYLEPSQKKLVEVYDAVDQAGLEKVLECKFIKWCRDNPQDLPEPLWYAMVSNLVRFNGGDETVHEYSKGYPTYSPGETDLKIAHALRDTGPHTCYYIKENGFECSRTCGVKSPAGLAYKRSSLSFGSDYLLDNGCLAKVDFKGDKRQTMRLCNFNLELHTDRLIDDGLEQERWFDGHIKVGGSTKPFLIRAKDFANNARLQEAISEQGGATCQFLQKYISDIRLAVQKLSPVKEERILKQFGWIDNETYISPSTIITKDGVLPHKDLKVDLSMAENARCLNIKILDDETHAQALQHIANDLLTLYDPTITYPTIGHVFAAPLIQFLSDGSRYILWLRGLTGSGKSFLARRVQQFFGNFEEKDIVSWTSTMNFVQMVGFYFKDAIFLADDFKSSNVQNKKELIQKIQSYADNAGRGRLNADSTTKQTRPIRGLMISTGEDIPVSEASTLARMLTIDLPRNEKKLEKGHRCLQYQHYYSGVMGRYIHWLLRSKRIGNIKGLEVNYQHYFYQDIAGQQNDSPISHNLAINMIGFECFCDFISDTEGGIIDFFDTRAMVEHHKELLKELRNKSITLVRDEQASNIFLRTLMDLINAKRVAIQDITSGDDQRNVVGFKKDGKIYIIPSLAFQEVQRVLRDSGNPLNFSTQEIGRQLMGDGLIKEYEPNRSTKIVWWNGKTYRVLVFSAEVFGEDHE
jgi:hypothetical protein